MYLVDTSVWLDFLRGTSHPRVALLEGLLEDGEAHLCEVTYAEICFGSRDQSQLEKYVAYFSALPFLLLPVNWHQEVARMGFVMKSKGFRPFIADLLIAFTALTHRAILLTSDKDFNVHRDLFGLVVE